MVAAEKSDRANSANRQRTLGGWLRQGTVHRIGKVEIAGDDGGSRLVALGDEVVKILVLGRAKIFQTEVVNDQQRDSGEVLEAPLVGIDGARGV